MFWGVFADGLGEFGIPAKLAGSGAGGAPTEGGLLVEGVQGDGLLVDILARVRICGEGCRVGAGRRVGVW